jgi:hypothetical protein
VLVSDDDVRPPAPPPPPPTPQPRRRRWVVPAAVAAVVAVGAGVAAYGLAIDDEDGAVTTAPAGLELDELEPALLTEDDVGVGFAATSGSGDDVELTSDDLGTSEQCQDVIAMFEESDDDDDLQVEFEDAAQASLSHSLALIDEGEPTMAQAREGIGRCGTIAWDDGQSQGQMTLSASEIDGPGNEAFEIEITIEATAAGFTATADDYGIFPMRDGVVSTVTGFGAIDPETFVGAPVDRELIRTMSERADENVRQLLDDQGLAA